MSDSIQHVQLNSDLKALSMTSDDDLEFILRPKIGGSLTMILVNSQTRILVNFDRAAAKRIRDYITEWMG